MKNCFSFDTISLFWFTSISILRKRIGTIQPIIYIGRYLLKQIKMKTHIIILWITAFGMTACHSPSASWYRWGDNPTRYHSDTGLCLSNQQRSSRYVHMEQCGKEGYLYPPLLLPSYGRTPRDKLSWWRYVHPFGREGTMDTSCRFQRQLFKQFPTRRERSRRICLPIFRGLSPERLHHSHFW